MTLPPIPKPIQKNRPSNPKGSRRFDPPLSATQSSNSTFSAVNPKIPLDRARGSPKEKYVDTSSLWPRRRQEESTGGYHGSELLTACVVRAVSSATRLLIPVFEYVVFHLCPLLCRADTHIALV
jgi:hypothetical protein